MQRIAFAFCWDAEGKTLIAPGRFALEICPDSPQVRVSRLSVSVHADEYGIVIGQALIQPSALQAEVD